MWTSNWLTRWFTMIDYRPVLVRSSLRKLAMACRIEEYPESEAAPWPRAIA
jgi:hypothetical protein